MKKYVNIHHTATFAKDDVAHQFNGVNISHKKRWEERTLSKLGFYGGYHYLVERDGIVRQFRGDEEVGAHNNQQEMNFKAIGVCFAGDMDEQQLTQKQFDEGLRLIQRLQEKYNIPRENIKGHRDYKNTHCPGIGIPKDIDMLSYFELNAGVQVESWEEEATKFAIESGISNGERLNEPATRVEVWEMLRRFKQFNNK